MIYCIDIKILVLLMFVGLIPMALDGLTQFLGLRESNNYLRLVTGLICGLVLGVLFNWLIVHVFIFDI